MSCGVELHNSNDDVEQDDAAVGLFLTVAVGEVCMLAHHLVDVAAGQLSLVLPICMSASSLSLYFFNLMTKALPGCKLLMVIDVPDADVVVDGLAVAEADVAAAVVSS